MTIALLSFLVCLGAFALVGYASARVSSGTADDYLLAGRGVSAWLAALSAVATNCSGYMFIGQIGLTYTVGVRSLWLAVGWILGDALVWAFVYRGVRERSAQAGARSVPTFVGGSSRPLVVVCALLVLAFLGTYAAAQLQAGGKALYAVLDLDPRLGASLGAGAVLYYSYSGGLRASIWTDAAQSVVMMTAMIAMLFASVATIGGPAALLARLASIDPALVEVTGTGGGFGFTPWALGWVGAGVAVIGQPTIVVRAMSIRSADELPRAAAVYFGWFVPFYAATIALGLAARVLLPSLGDPELAFPSLASQLLPGVLVGVVLAGIFAATMSTADSQILSCSAALVEDLAPRFARVKGAHARATVVVTVLALAIALSASSGVFALVLYAWAALGVTLGPLVVLRARGVVVSTGLGLAMMGAGLAAAFAHRALGYADAMYEVVPGMLASFGVYGLATFVASRRTTAASAA